MHQTRLRLVAALLGAGLCGATAPAAAALRHLSILQDIAHETDTPVRRRANWLDSTFHAAWSQAYLAYTFGSFDAGAEAGGFLRDRRGSTYGLTLRRRHGGRVENTSAEFESQQKLSRMVVATALKLYWPDRPAGDNLSLVPSAGLEVYYRNESFVTLRVTRDPRPGTGTTFRLANRLGTEHRYFEASLAPRSDGVVSWGVMGRMEWFRAGLGRENDYDFTSIDRQLFFFGFQYDLGP